MTLEADLWATHTHTGERAHMHIYMHKHTQRHIYRHTHTYIAHTNTHTHTRTRTCTYTQGNNKDESLLRVAMGTWENCPRFLYCWAVLQNNQFVDFSCSSTALDSNDWEATKPHGKVATPHSSHLKHHYSSRLRLGVGRGILCFGANSSS